MRRQRDKAHYLDMLDQNPNATVGLSLAAKAVAAARGHDEEDIETWRGIFRALQDKYGETLTADEVRTEMDRAPASMTPDQMARARDSLDLTLEEMATMLGYQGTQRRQMQFDLESGRRAIREPQRRLVEAYLSGYRPPDWPQ